MGKPVIKLKFNEELDRDVAWQFYGAKKICGVDFWKERAKKYHPALSHKDRAKFNGYIASYYEENEKIIGMLSRKIETNLEGK